MLTNAAQGRVTASPGAYAGVGSRDTPEFILDDMRALAHRLADEGWLLRSGAAPGADTAFEQGAGDRSEIYLPWANFNQSTSNLYPPKKQSLELAATLHPAWCYLSRPARLLMARNCYQVLGPGLDDPVKFVVCWTIDGSESSCTRTRKTGGTGQAISLASTRGIPVFNLANAGRLAELEAFLELMRDRRAGANQPLLSR